MTKRELECPSCGGKEKVEVYDSINVTVDPELRSFLLDGEINRFVCSSCYYEAFVPSPLPYNDMERKFCVQYFALDNMEDSEFLSTFQVKGGLPSDSLRGTSGNESTYLLKPHIVFSLEEMANYIIFREKLFEMNEGLA